MKHIVQNGTVVAGVKSSPVVKHSIERQIVMHDVKKMFLKYTACYRFPEQINQWWEDTCTSDIEL